MAVRVQPRQLALALPHAESLSRDNFLEGPANAAALSLVDSWPDWPNRIMLLAGPEGERLWAYWKDQLASPPPALDLPTDRPRPAVMTHRGGTASLRLDLLEPLKALGQRRGTTLYTATAPIATTPLATPIRLTWSDGFFVVPKVIGE